MAITKNIQVKNNDFQHLEVIKQNRYKRHRYGKFFIEGVRNINSAATNDWEIESFAYSEENSLSEWAKNILKTVPSEYHYRLTEVLMKELSDKEDTSELIAIGKMKERKFTDFPVKSDALIAVFDRPMSPGNLGTVIRSCDSFKADALIITGHSADLYDTATIKASVGSFFSLPIFVLESSEKIQPLFEKFQKTLADYQIVGTSAKAELSVDEADFKKATLLIIGNESSGMSAAYKELCHYCVRIPIYGTATSLNVGCAASIVLYEIDRQRKIKEV